MFLVIKIKSLGSDEYHNKIIKVGELFKKGSQITVKLYNLFEVNLKLMKKNQNSNQNETKKILSEPQNINFDFWRDESKLGKFPPPKKNERHKNEEYK